MEAAPGPSKISRSLYPPLTLSARKLVSENKSNLPKVRHLFLVELDTNTCLLAGFIVPLF